MLRNNASAKTAKRLLLLLALTSLTACGQHPTGQGIPGAVQPPSTGSSWYLGWRSETVFPHVSTTSQTCRFNAQLTAGGSRLRAEFTSPVVPGGGYTILGASVADAAAGGLNIEPGTVSTLTFSGRPGVEVAPGARILSDPVLFPTTSGSRISVTLTVSAGEAPATPNAIDMGACTPAPLASTDAETAPAAVFSQPRQLAWLRSLLVYGPPIRSIAAFGDSISVSPQEPLYNWWSDVLVGHDAAVVNAGAGGNYLTTMGMYGTAVGLSRLDDLLADPGISDVVMLMGTNDLAAGVSAASLLKGIATALHDAQVKHVRLWVCTILPRSGSTWSPAAETARLAVNSVLRSSWLPQHGGLLVDTDAAVRDPAHPDRLLPAYDAGDHVHPSAAGAHELGITIGLAIGLLL